MNKYLVSTLTLVAVLGGSVSPAFADNDSGIRGLLKKFRSEIKDDRKQLQDEQRDERREFRDSSASKSAALRLKLEAERNAKRESERNKRITKFWKKTGDRLQKLINRETKSADKIAARIQKFKDAGKNVSSQEALLVTARLKIGLAQTALNDANTQVGTLLAANKPAEALAKARELHKGVVATIRTAHKALVDVIVSTRGLSVTPTPTPTP